MLSFQAILFVHLHIIRKQNN